MAYLIYLFEASICMCCFYLLFHLLLRKETWFQLNRYYLVLSVLFSILIPLCYYSIEIPVLIDVVETGERVVMNNEPVTVLEPNDAVLQFDIYSIIGMVYMLGVSIFSFVFLRGLIQLRMIYASGKKEYKDNITYVYGKELKAVFSFMNYIFIHPGMDDFSKEERARIINHEKVHVSDRHSFDLMFFELVKIVFWFNPVIYVYKWSLMQVHEFIADERVIELEGSSIPYASFLIENLKKNTRVNSFCNHLFHEPIKNRLIMMNTSKSRGKNALLSLSAIPIMAVLIFYFSIDIQKVAVLNTPQPLENPTLAKVEDDTIPTPPPGASPPSSIPPGAKPGYCYAKCTIPEEYKVVDKVMLNVYTGNDANVDVEERKIIVRPAYSKWAKKETASNSDGVVWYIKEIPAQTKQVKVVKDINQTQEYETRTFEIFGRSASGNVHVWKQVVCKDDKTPELLENIQTRLKAEGLEVAVTGELDRATKVALIKYQRANDLPTGNLNIESLKALGIEM